jgi:dUTP pyrophosphatase
MSNENFMQEVKPEWAKPVYDVLATSTDGPATRINTVPDIPRVGHFEKVSLGQFKSAIKDEFASKWTDEQIERMYYNVSLPVRATKGSAGYDIKSPFDFTLQQGGVIKIPTGIRVIINEGWFLGCVPRSGLGFKYEIRLSNTLGIIDSDFSNSASEGHIWLKFRNGDNTLDVKAGNGIAQGIFLPYGITMDDEASGARNGGLGSTGV